MLMDGDFECLHGDLLAIGITLNTTSNDEHEAVIECFIRTLKDGVRSVYTVLHFRKISTLMLTDLVYNVIFWKNTFPHKDHIHHHLSPRAIITGLPVDFQLRCQHAYGERMSKPMKTMTTTCRKGPPASLPFVLLETSRVCGIS